MKYTGISEIGLYRKENQDKIAFVEREHALLALLCDGIGGANAGSIASNLCVSMLKEAFLESSEVLDSESAITWFGRVIKDINKAIYHESLIVPEYQGMGTTLVAAAIFADEMVVFNIGDSRLYLYTDGKLEAMTQDETYAYELYLRNEISLDEANIHPKRNILMNAVGIDEHISFQTKLIKNSWDMVLMSSDGLHGYVNDDAISLAMNHDSILKVRENLLELAYKAGAYDNISIILIEGDKND